MDPNLTRTISLVEALWAVLAVFGLIVHTVNATAANGDVRRLVLSATNSVRLLIATDSQRTEWVLWITQVAYVIAASLAMLRPPPIRTLGFPINSTLYLFLIAEGLLVWSSIIRRRTRHEVIQILEDRQAKP
jgi:hypothetical protein